MRRKPAEYVFKLRQNISIEDDLKLAALEIGSFFETPVEEVHEACDILDRLPALAELEGLARLETFTRNNTTRFYSCSGSIELLPELLRKTSFVQHLYCVTDNSKVAANLLKSSRVLSGPTVCSYAHKDSLVMHGIPHGALFEYSSVVARHSANVSEAKNKMRPMLQAMLGRTDDRNAIAVAASALQTARTSTYLSHDIHYYKAKSFPRMVRALINIGANQVKGSNHRVIDDFVGSGTTLLESALLGIPSVGVDIDPLSAMISRTKMSALAVGSELLEDEAERIHRFFEHGKNGQTTLFDRREKARVSASDIQFPTWLLKNRKMTATVAKELGREVLLLRSVVDGSPPSLLPLFKVLLSDAISRKVRMRILGTGSGRFSLTFAKASLADIFLSSLKRCSKNIAVFEWLRDNLDLDMAPAETVVADSRHLPENSSSFDILVTSPPYLPASSGRESYAKARALSLIALGFADRMGVDALIDQSIGSMNNREIVSKSLSEGERDLVDWLSRDALREPKSKPTARYFIDMRQAFSEMHRVLVPGGLAFVIVGKQSTFYKFETREPLYVVQFADLLLDEARSVGFVCEGVHDIQLKKLSGNARPRSLDDYYESILVLRKPSAG